MVKSNNCYSILLTANKELSESQVCSNFIFLYVLTSDVFIHIYIYINNNSNNDLQKIMALVVFC